VTTIINGSSPSITFSDGSAQTSATRPFLNRIINGAMVIDQRNAGASVTITSDGLYTLDRWQAYSDVGTSKYSVQQNAGSVTPPVGFTNYLGVTSLATTSVGSADYYMLSQKIEGYNVADLGFGTANAKTVTLSFWVYSSLTGTFGGAIQNNAGNRSYPFTYTISVADTWEQKTITIAGDTSGTWTTTNTAGIILRIGLGVGSTSSGTAGAWAGSSFYSATGATSVVGTNGATFYITGVQLEVGSTATSFDYRPYGTELALCQRYYFKVKPAAFSVISTGGYNSSTTVFQGFLQFPVTMRIAPTALEQSGTASHYDVVNQNGATTCSLVPTYVDVTDTIARTGFTVSSGLTAGGAGTARTGNATGFLAWSAEL